MRLTLDEEVHALYIEIKPAHAEHTIEIQEGFMADYDENNDLVGLEILNEDLFFRALRAAEGDIPIPERLAV